MAANPVATLGDTEAAQVLQQIDRPARRVHNRGLRDYVLLKAREYQGEEFRPEDLRHLVHEKYPVADAAAIGNALAELVRRRGGVERVGMRSGVYRVAGTGPQLDEEAVLDEALSAIAKLEELVHRYRELLPAIRSLKKALGST